MLNRDQILAATAKPAATLKIEEWGGEVGVRRLTCAEVESVTNRGEEDQITYLRFIAALALVDGDNRPLFAQGDEALAGLSYATLQKIEAALYEANCMTQESRERLRKNLEPALACSTG